MARQRDRVRRFESVRLGRAGLVARQRWGVRLPAAEPPAPGTPLAQHRGVEGAAAVDVVMGWGPPASAGGRVAARVSARSGLVPSDSEGVVCVWPTMGDGTKG
jgi:hypothetical protein